MKSQARPRKYGLWMAAAGILLVALGIGCSAPNTANRTVVISVLSVSPSSVQQGEAAVIEVEVTDGQGHPLENVTVTLTASPITNGTLGTTTLTTGADGTAATVYTASAAGTVTIKATAESATARQVSVTVEGSISSGTAGMALEIEPRRLRADGQSQALVVVHVSDASGNPAPDNTPVKLVAGEPFTDANQNGTFTASIDSLFTDYDADGVWDAVGHIDSLLYTSGGVATTHYTAGTVAESVYVMATARVNNKLAQSMKGVLLMGTDSIASINLAPERQRTQVRATGGIEWTRVVATAFDAHGNRAPQDLLIEFTITAGPGGGENINGDPVGPVAALTDGNGEATVTFNSGITSGTVRIRATAGAVVSAATQIAVVSGPPAYVSVGARDCNVPSWEVVNYLNEIVAVVNDQWGNEVADSTAVHFWAEQGTIEGFDATHIVYTERGTAVSMWHSSKPKNDGIVVYWAATDGGQVADTSSFFESGRPGVTTIVTYPQELLADGRDKGRVVVEVYDINGVFMDTDYPITLRSTYGSISSGTLGDGCHASYYETELFSKTFDMDHSYTVPDDGIVGISLLEALAGGYYGAYDSKTVIFRSTAAFTGNCDVKVETTVPHGYSVPVEVVVKDRYGNPLGGHKIVLTTQNGTITNPTQYTDPWGVAAGFVYTTTSDFGIALDILQAADQDPGYGGIVITKKINIKEQE